MKHFNARMFCPFRRVLFRVICSNRAFTSSPMLYNQSVITPLRVVQIIVESFEVKEPSRPKPRLFCWTTGLTFCCLFLQNSCKASLKICILKLYTRGFTIEFTRYMTSTSQNTSGVNKASLTKFSPWVDNKSRLPKRKRWSNCYKNCFLKS